MFLIRGLIAKHGPVTMSSEHVLDLYEQSRIMTYTQG